MNALVRTEWLDYHRLNYECVAVYNVSGRQITW